MRVRRFKQYLRSIISNGRFPYRYVPSLECFLVLENQFRYIKIPLNMNYQIIRNHNISKLLKDQFYIFILVLSLFLIYSYFVSPHILYLVNISSQEISSASQSFHSCCFFIFSVALLLVGEMHIFIPELGHHVLGFHPMCIYSPSTIFYNIWVTFLS